MCLARVLWLKDKIQSKFLSGRHQFWGEKKRAAAEVILP
jgi:hypothetical protein